MITLKSVEEIPNTKWIDNLAETPSNNLPITAEVIEAKPVSKPVAQGWRWPYYLVGLAIYLAAIANNVYSCWLLTGAAFWVTVLTAVIGETALMAALPRALRFNVVAMALAALAFVVVGLNELRVIALTTADQAHARAALAVSEVASACPPASTTIEKTKRGTKTTSVAESEGCKLAKTNMPEARPELAAFQSTMAWLSRGSWSPTGEDYDHLRSLALVLFLNSGGAFLALARR
jgi:hypothetical protein